MTKKPRTAKKTAEKMNHILIIKNLYFEFDGKRIGAEQAQIYLTIYRIIRKQPIAGGVCYELGE